MAGRTLLPLLLAAVACAVPSPLAAPAEAIALSDSTIIAADPLLVARQTNSGNTNGPSSRNQWTTGYDITNDTEAVWPTTGVVREYFLTITNTTCNPDGHGDVPCMLYNGQIPGPTISADWGDTVRVHVTNNLQDNGTSTHFHGLRQFGSNSQDGVNGVTECPLAPGKTETYEWQATQHGTTWYHSHYTAQYGAGLYGPIVINGPSTANYDVDLGPMMMNEWHYQPLFAVEEVALHNSAAGRPGPVAENILINGKAKDANGDGAYATTTVTSGATHKLRLINSGVDNAYRFSIDNHTMTVVAVDLVPVVPFTVDSIFVGVAQRYDVLIEANQPSGAYWIRAWVDGSCAAFPIRHGIAVLKYSDYSAANQPVGAEPTSTPYPLNCQAPTGIVPAWAPNVGSLDQFKAAFGTFPMTLDRSQTTPGGDFVFWKLNTSSIDIMWEKPTLSYVAEGNTSYPASSAITELPTLGGVTYWVVQSVPGAMSFVPHPIHLHGHDFYVLGKGRGVFDINTAQLNFENPVRRDTQYIDGDGYSKQGTWLAFAFEVNNPGAWLMHCHIAAHISGGLGMQFLEAKDQIPAPSQDYYQQCQDWESYYATSAWKKDDSGL